MTYIVFDLEWNQPQPHATTDPELLRRLPFEVIEIGAVRISAQFDVQDTFYGRIRPRHYRTINPFIAKVTKQNTASLKKGQPFETVAKDFQAFCGDDPVFLSWSPSDPYVWLQNVAYFTPERAAPLRAVDLQLFFQMKAEPALLGQQRSLESTLDLLGLDKPADFHSALTDAAGTADVLLHMAARGQADDLAAYAAEITEMARADATRGTEAPGSLRPVLDALRTVCPHNDHALIVSPVKKGNRYQAMRLSACPRHGLIRETLSRKDVSEPVRFAQKFLFVGAAFLAIKTAKRPRAAVPETSGDAESAPDSGD